MFNYHHFGLPLALHPMLQAILADTPGGFDLLVGSDIILSSFAPGFRIADFTEPVWRVLESLFLVL